MRRFRPQILLRSRLSRTESLRKKEAEARELCAAHARDLAAAKKRKEEEKACKAEGKPYIAPLDPTEAEAQQAARDDKALDARAPASENKRPGWRP